MDDKNSSQSPPRAETKWIDAWIRWERNSESEPDEDPPLPVATHTFRFVHHVVSKHSILLQLQGFPSDSEQTWNSTGLTLWPSSEILCDYLVQKFRTGAFNHKFLLELGSGLGRCGILAAKLLEWAREGSNTASSRGASSADSHIYVTDGDTDALAQLRVNVRHNDLHDSHLLCVKQLLWGADAANAFCHQHNRPSFLFGSDLIYVPSVIGPLFETVGVFLRRSDSQRPRFVMAHCQRRAGNSVTLDMVLEGAKQQGLVLIQTERQDSCGDENIVILEFGLKAGE